MSKIIFPSDLIRDLKVRLLTSDFCIVPPGLFEIQSQYSDKGSTSSENPGKSKFEMTRTAKQGPHLILVEIFGNILGFGKNTPEDSE